MKILICGAGEVGGAIAKYLAAQDNQITLIDSREDVLSALKDAIDIKAVIGHASRPSVLKEAGAEDADMVIAVTDNDEVNIMTCEMATVLFKVPLKICRIRSKDLLDPKVVDFYKNLRVIDHIIFPEYEIAGAIIRNIAVPGAFETIEMAGGKVTLLGLKCLEGCPVVHASISQIEALFPTLNMTMVGIIRNGEVLKIHADQMVAAGDDVYVVVDSLEIARAMNAFGITPKETHKIAIFGGGKVSRLLAGMIADDRRIGSVTLVEMDRDKATALALEFKGKDIEVVHGDVLNPEILEEIGIKTTDMVIGATSADEDNILSALLAKKIAGGSLQTIALINRQIYSQLVSNLGVDAVIDPNAITVSTILQHTRKGNISSAYSLKSELAEALEVKVLETSRLPGREIREIKLPAGVMIGSVIRGGEILKPKPDLVIEAEDIVILFVAAGEIKMIEKMISVSVEYF